MIHNTQKKDERNIYVVMKTLSTPSYHHNGFTAIHELGHIVYGYTSVVPINQRAQFFVYINMNKLQLKI